MPSTDDAAVHLVLPRRYVGQILDGLEVLIEHWDTTAAWFRGEIGEIQMRECSDAEEAESIADYYREIAAEIRRQMGTLA